MLLEYKAFLPSSPTLFTISTPQKPSGHFLKWLRICLVLSLSFILPFVVLQKLHSINLCMFPYPSGDNTRATIPSVQKNQTCQDIWNKWLSIHFVPFLLGFLFVLPKYVNGFIACLPAVQLVQFKCISLQKSQTVIHYDFSRWHLNR